MQTKISLTLTMILFFLQVTTPQITECTSYVKQLISDLLDFKITSIPIPSLMYSGITTNNPGMVTECQNSNYSYFLIFIKNTTANTSTSESFTGLCVPSQCTADDIEIALEFLRSRVYDRESLDIGDRVGFVGGIVVGVWVLAVLVCSFRSYFGEPVVNQYLVGEKGDSSGSSGVANGGSGGANGSSNENSSQNHPSTQTYSYSQSKQQNNYIFNYYKGYKKIFIIPDKPNILSLVLFLAVVSFSLSIEFSYRQNIAQNVDEVYQVLDSWWGVMICNVEIALQTVIFVLGFKLAYGMAKIRKFTKIGRIFFDLLLRKWLNLILISLLVYSFLNQTVSRPLSLLWSQTNGKDCPYYIWQIWFVFRNLQLDCKVCLPWFTLLEADLLFTLLSAPLIILFRTSKKIGYALCVLLVLGSIMVSGAILKNEMIIFEPAKLMNGQKEYWIDYQGNAFVRMGAYFIGVAVGVGVTEAQERGRGQGNVQSKFGALLDRVKTLQWAIFVIGIALMTFCYVLIRPYLSMPRQDLQPYPYIVLTPLMFIVGLTLTILPYYLQCSSPLTKLLDRTLGWPRLIHLDCISLNFYLLAPMVTGFSVYSSQNSGRYGVWTVGVYGLGDLFLTYFLGIGVTACFENQLVPIVGWVKGKILGKETQYGDILVEYL